MARERLTGEVDDYYAPELPFHYRGRVYKIDIAEVTEEGVLTGKYKPLISVEGTQLDHPIPRSDTRDDAHLEALRWIRDAYRASV